MARASGFGLGAGMDQPQHLHRSVAERLVAEGLVLVVKAASDAGVSISTKTAIRWCLNGVRGVRLESVKVRGRRMTSRPAFTRFVAATQPQVEGRSQEKQSTMDAYWADQVLQAFGLGRDPQHQAHRHPSGGRR